MGVWKSKPNIYTRHNFIEIPAGDHRVQICDVRVERFKDEKKCFEITLKVSGYHGKLWYYLWSNPEFGLSSTKRLAAFFESFNIEDSDLKNYKKWIGKSGAVTVVHEHGPTEELNEGEYEARVTCCLNQFQQSRLPAWDEKTKND